MRFPLATAILLLISAVLATAVSASFDCYGDGQLARPAHVDLAGKSYYLNATGRTSLLLYGDANFFVTAPPDALACAIIQCGPSTDACTLGAGSYLVNVYATGGVGEFVLLSYDCLAAQLPGCRPPAA